MKKTVFSLTIIMAVIISAFSIFAMPASATLLPDNRVTPSDMILLGSNDDYYETMLEDFQANRAYFIPLSIEQTGLRIIQTFGAGSSDRVKLQLLDANRNVLYGTTQGFVGYGYTGSGYNNSFFQYNFTSGQYYLKITLGTSDPIRLSITLADAYFDNSAPIVNYNQITNYFPNYEYFDVSTPAKVWIVDRAMLAEFDENENGNVKIIMTLNTNDYAEAYLLDPTASYLYSGLFLYDNSSGEMQATTAQSYYLVLATRWNRVLETTIVEAEIILEIIDQ